MLKCADQNESSSQYIRKDIKTKFDAEKFRGVPGPFCFLNPANTRRPGDVP